MLDRELGPSPINCLFLLARALGLSTFELSGDKPRLELEPMFALLGLYSSMLAFFCFRAKYP